MEFEIPEHLNRNAAEVRALGSPAFTGKILLSFMCQRMGLQDLSRKAVLDVGCGTRFASAILTHNIPIGRYIGVDVDREAIYWLRDNVNKPNMEFHCIDQENPMYNPGGRFPALIGRSLPVLTYAACSPSSRTSCRRLRSICFEKLRGASRQRVTCFSRHIFMMAMSLIGNSERRLPTSRHILSVNCAACWCGPAGKSSLSIRAGQILPTILFLCR